jgi:hypothetical protein
VKKYLLVCLALVALLTTMGVGYSMWSQTVTITGSVNTGYISFTATAPSGTWVYKDVNNSGAVIIEQDVAQNAVNGNDTGPSNYTPPGGALLIGSAYVVSLNNCGIGSNAVTETVAFNKIFPVFTGNTANIPLSWEVDLTLTNTGTVPVKVELGALSVSGSGFGNFPVANITWDTATEGQQIDPLGTANVSIDIVVPDDNSVQNLTGTVTGTIYLVQWNEYHAGPHTGP